MNDWRFRSLQESIVADRPICYGVLKPGDHIQGGTPLIRITDVNNGEIDKVGLHCIGRALDNEFKRAKVRPGDLVLSIQGTIGRVAIVPESLDQANISRTIARISLSESCCPRFYYHWMVSHIGQQAMIDTITGTTRSSLNIAALRLIQVPDPPLDEQRRIAAILDASEATIRATEAVIEKLRLERRGLVRQQIPLPGAQHANVELSVRPLGSCVDILDSQRIPVNSDERAGRLGAVPYYGANGLQGYIDKPIFNEPLILMAEDGGNFDDFDTRPIAYTIDGPSWVNNHAHILRPGPDLDFWFLFFQLEHRDIRRYISGGTRGKLTQAELRAIELVLLPKTKQIEIAAVIRAMDKRIRDDERHLDKLRLQHQGLLHDLLTGAVRTHA